MRSLTFVFGTGRSGSTALSRILNAHPDVLSLNEYMASVGDAAFPRGKVDGEEFWQALFRPAPHFERMIRSGLPLPEFLHTRRPGRYSARTAGIPALSLMVLPHLTDDPDGLLDELGAAVTRWPERTAAAHHRALFGLLCARFGRTAVVERSGYSTGWAPGLRETFPDAKFVHMFRDGPDCALSMSRHPGYRVIHLLREIKTRSGVDGFASLTPEHIRALPRTWRPCSTNASIPHSCATGTSPYGPSAPCGPNSSPRQRSSSPGSPPTGAPPSPTRTCWTTLPKS